MGGSPLLHRLRQSRDTDFSLGELTPKHFSFNSHLGACPVCHGLGTEAGARSGADDFGSAKTTRRGRDRPVAPRERNGCRPITASSKARSLSISKSTEDMPFAELPENFKQALYFGTGEQPIEMSFGGGNGRAEKLASVRRSGPANAAALRRNRKRIHPQSDPRVHEPRDLQGLRRRAAKAGDPGGHDREDAAAAS